MIDDPLPQDWRALQSGVCRLFNEVGLTANVEVACTTPRGQVTVDVHAVDERSVDRIQYIVECKNWNAPIPQSVVHSFTTVMHETGANIGFIVSRHGLQSGALQYTQNTNIQGLTYLQLQQRYYQAWWEGHFSIALGDAGDDLLQYVEPINSLRERIAEAELDSLQYGRFTSMVDKYAVLAMFTSMHNMGRYVNLRTSTFKTPALVRPRSVDDLMNVYKGIAPDFHTEATTMRGFLEDMVQYLRRVTDQFHDLFGRNIFGETPTG
jgi:hypothetical protein